MSTTPILDRTLSPAAPLQAGRARWQIRAVIGGSIGNLIEWYDWFVYSAFALYFAEVFFPQGDRTAQLLSVAGVFAVGFLMRPIGSWLMGVYADRAGRRAALVLSMTIMAGSSLVIALTPGYASIGFFAPLILLLARVAQGLSVGGEYGAVATYLSEVAGRERRGLFASFQYVTLIMGQLIALAVLLLLQYLLTTDDLEAWGWRVPFVIGGFGAIGAYWLRRGIEESPSFEASRSRRAAVKTWQLMAQHPRELAIVLGLTAGGALGFYTFGTYMQKFLANTAGFSRSTATAITAAAMVVFMLAQPLMGWISDKVGRRPLLIAYGAAATLMTVPLLTWIGGTRDALTAFLLVSLALLVQSAYTSISGLYKAELFPIEIRALGVGLPYAVAVSAIGGTAELVALLLKQAGYESGFYWYVTAFMSLVLLTAVLMRETQRHSRIAD
jgi:MFS transporter, MHS family, alpha-ketoglutarate permease